MMHDSVMNPAEVVKQRMQMYNSPYKSCTDCLLHVWRSEGVQAFYRSFTTQLTMNIPFQCVHFVTYEFLQEVSRSSSLPAFQGLRMNGANTQRHRHNDSREKIARLFETSTLIRNRTES